MGSLVAMLISMKTAPSLFNRVSGVAWYLTTYLAIVAVPPLLWIFARDETASHRLKVTGGVMVAVLFLPPVLVVVVILGTGALAS